MRFLQTILIKTVSVFFLWISFVKVNGQNIDTLVDVGNHKLHFNVLKGKGVPILFESGAGNDGSIWDTIIKPLYNALGATLIRYDRAGFGKSEIDTTGLNIVSEVRDLEIGLKKLGFSDKYFLVAHSLGGNYAMAFNKRNSTKVVGGVFVDILTPCFMTRERAVEVQRLFKDSLASIKKESPGFYYIIKNYQHTSRVMRESANSLKMPLTIICADSPPFEGTDSIKWKSCIQLFANENSNRNFLLAENCGHFVFKENPKLVIDAIVRQYKQ